MRGRSGMIVSVDDNAAHNSIDEVLVQDSAGPAAIRQFDRKTVAGMRLVLLEFSLSCNAPSNSRLRLREWFRISSQNHNQVVVRGLFDKQRLLSATEHYTTSAASPKVLAAPELRDASSSRSDAYVTSESDYEQLESERKKALKRMASRCFEDCRFVSFHPVTKRPIARDVNHPPRPEDPRHLSYLGEEYSYGARNQRSKAFLAAAQAAQELSFISNSKRVLKSMVKLLPPEMQEAELASIASIKRKGTHVNFEHVLDDINSDIATATASASAIAGESVSTAQPTWPSSFAAGCYVEIKGAIVKTDLNNRRVRLYEQSETPSVWVIRILGKNSGLWRCHEKFMSPLPALEQARARPASHDAGFIDVAIDETGQPTGDLPSIVHRQFGAEYSQSLTAKIEDLKARYSEIFSKDVTEPCGFEKMNIVLIPNAILPSKSRFYRNTPKMKEEVRRQIQEQLQWGAIRKAETAPLRRL